MRIRFNAGAIAAATAALPQGLFPATRDWTEDAVYENGNYANTCHRCGNHFVGLKRRVTCKLCAQQQEAP